MVYRVLFQSREADTGIRYPASGIQIPISGNRYWILFLDISLKRIIVDKIFNDVPAKGSEEFQIVEFCPVTLL